MIIIKILTAFLPYGIIRLYREIDKSHITKERYLTAARYPDREPKKDVFDTTYKYNLWNSNESRSGHGSELKNTKNIRKKLPILWKRFNIKTFLDAPCGDFNWMKMIRKDDIEYIGIDVVDEAIEHNNQKYKSNNVTFKRLDITNDTLPKVDMILCKDCLQHLSFENVKNALQNFKKSGSKYLLVTSYPLTKTNWDINDGGYRPLNIFIEPINLPAPIYKFYEGRRGGDIDRTEYLIDLEKW
jgi:hypothetical protein